MNKFFIPKDSAEEMEKEYLEKYKNDKYQPMYCYIPELEEIFQYDAMVSDSKYLEDYENWKFVGVGHCVFTIIEKGTFDNPISLRVGYSERPCWFFNRKQS